MLRSLITSYSQLLINAETKQSVLVSNHAYSNFLVDFRMDPIFLRFQNADTATLDKERSREFGNQRADARTRVCKITAFTLRPRLV
jgi:hypothetical protein